MNIAGCAGLVVATLFSGVTQALDWELRPRVSTGVLQYSFEQDPQLFKSESQVVSTGELEAEDLLLFAGVGVSAFFGNFIIDLSFQKTGEGEDNVTQDVFTFDALTEGNPRAFDIQGDTQRKITREDFSLSIGYELTNRLGVFAGYKKNETRFKDQIRIDVINLLIDAPFLASEALNREISLDQDGYFLGASYVWPFESIDWLNGAMSIDVGVAFLDGDLKEEGEFSVVNFIFFGTTTNASLLDSEIDASGDAVGLNLGVTWSGTLTDRLGYSFGVDYYDYSYDGDNSADFRDTLFRFALGLNYTLGVN